MTSAIKKRVAVREKEFDSIATKDDLRAIQKAHKDLKRGKTVSLSSLNISSSLCFKLEHANEKFSWLLNISKARILA
ncbi:MAG: hypothetical protein ACYCQJ_02690 [Nitrososphaerales archaeon]